jgi:hypothetical protein
MLDDWLRGVHGVYLVYSIASRQSFTEIERFLTAAKKSFDFKKFPLFIVGYALSSSFSRVLIFPNLVISAI